MLFVDALDNYETYSTIDITATTVLKCDLQIPIPSDQFGATLNKY